MTGLSTNARALSYPPMALNNSMEHNPSWGANSFLSDQEIPRILWKPKVSYPTHNRPSATPYIKPKVSYPTHNRPSATPYIKFTSSQTIFKIHFSNHRPIYQESSRWSPTFKFPHQNPVRTALFSAMRATCSAHLILLDLVNRTILGQE